MEASIILYTIDKKNLKGIETAFETYINELVL